ncbi:hypothetical protein RF074_25430, partial [Serratia marcescens]|uniref:hypothetical protein n=1 Tax=Serratia marcescens TaxID=615 RepID=UPI0028139FBF
FWVAILPALFSADQKLVFECPSMYQPFGFKIAADIFGVQVLLPSCAPDVISANASDVGVIELAIE